MRRFTAEERAAQKRQINELHAEFYGGAGEPAKYDITSAGPQANLFVVQAQQPKGAIKSNIPLAKQIEGTLFDQTTPPEPSFFDRKDGQEDKR